MSVPKKQLPEYLSFTRKERTGIIAILVLILLFTAMPFLFPLFISLKKTDHTAFEKEIAALHIKERDSTGYAGKNYTHDEYRAYDRPSSGRYQEKAFTGTLFYFDPNTVPVDGWTRLGVREKTALTIQKYIAKGGRFYKPEDIAKIWGLRPDEVSRLMPYVKIEAKQANTYAGAEKGGSNRTYEKAKYSITTIDINTADTTALIALPGIGSKLANRIITFREKLGGFYKIEQVAETYALADSVFQKIKDKLVISSDQVKQMNINKATLEELKMHPYARYTIANAIIQYRTQHGDFAAVSDLKKIMIITEDVYNKLVPYLTVK